MAWLYAGVHAFGYVWDDRAFFLTSTSLREGSVFAAITEPVLAGSAYFRPLVMGWFVAEIRLLGANPAYPHLANLALHLANTLLVGLLARRLSTPGANDPAKSAWRSLAAMLLYGLHPALTEPVAWISGRFDLTVSFFGLLAVLLMLSANPRLRILSAVAFSAATMSKEMAVTIPLIAFLMVWVANHPGRPVQAVIREERRREKVWSWLALVFAGAVYLVIRLQFVRSLGNPDPALAAQLKAPLQHAAFVGQTLAFYFQTIVWPFTGLGPMHPFDAASMTGLEVFAGIAVVVAATGFALWAIVRPSATGLLLLAALISLLPVANIIPLNIVGSIGHERFLVLPLAFAVLAVFSLPAMRWNLSPAMRRYLPAAVVAGVSIWSAVAVLNIRVTLPLWRNDLVLWKWAYASHPDSPFAQFSLAAAALREQNYEVAKSVIDEAEKRGALPLRLSIPYGQYLIRNNQADAGIAKIQAALSQEPLPHLRVLRDGVALEDAHIRRGDFGGWLQVYAFNAMAEGHMSRRRFALARQDTEIALFYQRDNPTARLLKSLADYGLDKWDLAESEFISARDSYAPGEREGIVRYRSIFLRQLCEVAQENPETCSRFARESPPAADAGK